LRAEANELGRRKTVFVNQATIVLQPQQNLVAGLRHGQNRADLVAQIRHCRRLDVPMEVQDIGAWPPVGIRLLPGFARGLGGLCMRLVLAFRQHLLAQDIRQIPVSLVEMLDRQSAGIPVPP